MIQRIQSVLLLLAAVAVFALFKLPFGSSETIAASTLFNDGIFSIQDHVGLLGLFCAAGAIAFISIFLFNNRPLQLKLSRVAIIANVIGIILAAVLFMQDSQAMGAAIPKEELGLGLPVLSIIFAALAIRFINKDENLVKSMDRLR
ncbi:MAG: DUF4293 domain-containing protein [Saprospiraceae bacterium]